MTVNSQQPVVKLPPITPGHVVVYPSDATGCGVYRMIYPGKAVAKTGKPVHVIQKSPQIYVNTQTKKIHGVNVGTANVVVFQRPGSYQISEIIPILQSQGRKVVIDMDDSLSLIHPQNPAFKVYDPRVNHKTNYLHAARACEIADLVTVTTPGLADEYGKHGRVIVIPNHVPESYLKIQRVVNDAPIVGWAGWTKTHVNDLRVTSGMINQALTETNAKFAAFGNPEIFTEFGIRKRPPHEHWSFTSIADYPKKLSKLDIGLVPLQPSPFNSKKSWLKALEYASVGVVPVVSPTYDNLRLVELGAAVRADKPGDWYREVKELILDNDKREEMSKRAREVAAEWTIEGNCWKWYDAWTGTYKDSDVQNKNESLL